MNGLNYNEIIRINQLIDKLRNKGTTSNDMSEFLNLVHKSGENNWFELQNYVQTAGYNSIDHFQQHLNEKRSKEFVDGLVKIGLAILIAYGLAKLFEKR